MATSPKRIVDRVSVEYLIRDFQKDGRHTGFVMLNSDGKPTNILLKLDGIVIPYTCDNGDLPEMNVDDAHWEGLPINFRQYRRTYVEAALSRIVEKWEEVRQVETKAVTPSMITISSNYYPRLEETLTKDFLVGKVKSRLAISLEDTGMPS